MKVDWVLAPFSAWFQGKWGNIWCGGQFHCRGMCSLGASLCMVLGHDHDHDLGLHLFGYMWRSFD
jgi:hypothetical protein